MIEAEHIPDTSASMAGRRILLTGASGMIGTAVVARLRALGAETIQVARQAGRSQLRWNPAQPEPFEDPARLEGLDAAIHLSGANVASHRWTPAFKQEIVSSRAVTTAALSRALAKLSRPPGVLISASATGLYGDRGDEILDESSAAGTGFLAETCVRWEAATAQAEQADIRVVHLRTGVVLAPEGGALAKLLPLFRLGLGGRLGSGREWMSWITLADVISAVVHALGTPTLAGACNCVAPGPVTNEDFTRALAGALHRPALLPVPAFALRLAVGEMADAALLASCRAVPARLLASGFRFAHPEIAGALRALLR
jgi:uncharacterized protein (TIGR01777 family)